MLPPTSHAIPMFIIMDLSWALELEDEYNWFLQRFPIRDIIASFSSIDTYEDCNDKLWNEVDRRLFDMMDEYDLMSIENMFETLMEYFYQALERLIPGHSDAYIYHSWLDDRSIVMIRTKYANDYPFKATRHNPFTG